MEFPLNFIRNSEKYCELDNYVPAPYFRKSFDINNAHIKNATLLICGLGFYEVHINGKNITKGYLAPYRSNHNDYIYYDSYDVISNLQHGKNVLAVILGNGFQNPMADTWDFNKTVWRGAPILSFSLEIEYEDGQKQHIVSDTETKTVDSPIIFNDLHFGEYYDARLEIENWDTACFDDTQWHNAQVAPRPHGKPRLCTVEPIVKRAERVPVAITECDGGFIYDFGVNDAGVCRLSIKGEEGQKILLQHYEKVVNGKPFFNNIKLRPYQRFQEDEYICSGRGTEVHIPRFTYHGFRYVYVTGITKKQATKELLTYLCLSSDIKQIGSFECSDKTINKIQEATLRSDISNFHYFPTDCPQREKNGWTADASLSAEQLLLNFACEKSLKEWLVNIYKSINDDGQLSGIIPNSGWGYDALNGPAWDNVIVNLPYYIYIYRGDKSVLEEVKIPLMRYLTNLYCKLDSDNLMEYGLGDWCQAGTKHEDEFDTPAIVTNSIMTVDIADKAAFIYDILDMKEQKEYAQKLAYKVKRAIRAKLYDVDNATSLCRTQTAQAMAIYYNIFELDEIPKAIKVLVELIKENNGFMKVGVLGARVIFRVLAENGYIDLAYDMITRPEFPSYGNWIERGATTLWEMFTLDDTAKGSLNHHFWGDVSAWFYTYLAGIKINPEKNDPNSVNLYLSPASKVDFVKAECTLPCGKFAVEWKRETDKIILKIDCADNVKGNILLNDKLKFIDSKQAKPINKGEYIIVTDGYQK